MKLMTLMSKNYSALKKHPRGEHFTNSDDLVICVEIFFGDRPINFFSDAIDEMVSQWKRWCLCIIHVAKIKDCFFPDEPGYLLNVFLRIGWKIVEIQAQYTIDKN